MNCVTLTSLNFDLYINKKYRFEMTSSKNESTLWPSILRKEPQINSKRIHFSKFKLTENDSKMQGLSNF